MSLESKAKTTNEILIYVHDATGFIGIVPHQGEKLVEYGNQKWVSLEEAQKVIKKKYNDGVEALLGKQVEIQDLKENFKKANQCAKIFVKKAEKLEDENAQLREKMITKVQKLLNECCKECEHDTFESDCPNDCKINDLRDILFSRKEERLLR
jgi:hypothetical protein